MFHVLKKVTKTDTESAERGGKKKETPTRNMFHKEKQGKMSTTPSVIHDQGVNASRLFI